MSEPKVILFRGVPMIEGWGKDLGERRISSRTR